MQTLPLPSRYISTGDSSAGGMGSVLVCHDTVLERKVAIKVIHRTTHQRRMRDELAALLKMRSKHVVQVYDILKLDDNLAIVQEFIDGQDLLDGHRISSTPTDFYKQIWQIASGISDIHALEVIHRDIKPNNMKTDPEGIIKIFDFGLARDEGPSAATVGFVGTHGFSAPELYSGAPQFTKAVDTYAFGATALFLTTGRLPPDLMTRPPVPSRISYFSDVSPVLASEIVDCLDACLASVPGERPPMSNVRDILARHLLFDRHKALVVVEGKASYLDSSIRSIALRFTGIGEFEIHYDGVDFRVTTVSGEVFVNNHAVVAGYPLPGSCVISLGGSDRMARDRKFITFDLSHPEIVL